MQPAGRFLILDSKVFENVLILQKMFLYYKKCSYINIRNKKITFLKKCSYIQPCEKVKLGAENCIFLLGK